MYDRNGNLSVIRIGTFAAVIGLLLIVGAIVFFFVDRASHQVPLEVQPYPGAISQGQIQRSNISRTEFYQIPDVSPEDVMAYYQTQMDSFYGPDTEPEFKSCKRFPAEGNSPQYDQGQTGIVPYQFTCFFDRSGFFLSQFTSVVIQPGVGDKQGITVVAYEQTWQS